MSFQSVRNRVVCQHVTEISERPLDATVTPGAILLSHPHNQIGDFPAHSSSSRCSKRATIVLLSDQFSMPSQQSFWGDDVRHLFQQLPTKLSPSRPIGGAGCR